MEQKLRMTCFVANEHEAVENTFFAVKKLPKKVKPESTSALKYIAKYCDSPIVLFSQKPEYLRFSEDSAKRLEDLFVSSKALIAYSDYSD